MKALPTLDPLLHQPVRTRIIGMLVRYGKVTFTDLTSVLAITDGNLDAHMKKLVAAGYIHTTMDIKSALGGARTRTLYSLSDSGNKAYSQYVIALKQIIK